MSDWTESAQFSEIFTASLTHSETCLQFTCLPLSAQHVASGVTGIHPIPGSIVFEVSASLPNVKIGFFFAGWASARGSGFGFAQCSELKVSGSEEDCILIIRFHLFVSLCRSLVLKVYSLIKFLGSLQLNKFLESLQLDKISRPTTSFHLQSAPFTVRSHKTPGFFVPYLPAPPCLVPMKPTVTSLHTQNSPHISGMISAIRCQPPSCKLNVSFFLSVFRRLLES